MRAVWAAVAIAAFLAACSAPLGDVTEVEGLEPGLLAEAQHMLALPGGSCEPAPPTLNGGTFGPFDQICHIGSPTYPAVEFTHTGPAFVGVTGHRMTGLVYHPVTSEYREIVTCMRHLEGHWSEFFRDASQTDCPTGYEFTGV